MGGSTSRTGTARAGGNRVARVAFIKVFPGLNLGVAQLSAELQRAGHDTLSIYFKSYKMVPESEIGNGYQTTEMNAGIIVTARARRVNLNAFTPITRRELDLLLETLREFRPTLIGFSLHTDCMREGAQLTATIKESMAVPVVWGGVGPTLQPERALAHADIVCIGEGEGAIVELAETLEAGGDISRIRNLWVKRGDEVVKNPGRPMVDLNQIAIPDFEPSRTVFIEDDRLMRNVYAPSINGSRQYMIMTQRGCPYSCSFCVESYYQDKFGKKDHLRRRSVDVVIEELVAAKEKHDMKAIMFYDDVFTINHKWLAEFAPRYKAEVGLPFWCYTYPRSTRREQLDLLKDAGLASVTMGVQSGSEEVLSSYNRPVPSRMTIDAAREIVDLGLRGFFELITQSEFETEETCRKTFEFLADMPIEMNMIGVFPMIRYPHYGYTERVIQENQKFTVSERDYYYYHKLYLLARTTLSRRLVRLLGKSRLVRRFPDILDPLLPTQLPFFMINDHAVDLSWGGAEGTNESASPAASRETFLPVPQHTPH